MKLLRIGFKDFRSFGHSQWNYINLDDKFSLFIGKNNSGKSNILELLKMIRLFDFRKNNSNDTSNSPLVVTDYFQLDNRNILQFILDFRVENEEDYKWLDFRNPYSENVYFEFTTKEGRAILNKSFIDELEINTEKDVNRLNSILKNLTSRFLGIKNSSQDNKDMLIQTLPEDLNFLKNYFKEILILPQFRKITSTGAKDDFNVDGKNLINKLNKMKNASFDHLEDQEKFKEIEGYIGDLLDEKNIEIKIPYTNDSIEIKMNDMVLPLDKLGTGTHELIIMICAILLEKDNYIIGIEEPEIHIHPGLQKRFINILSEFDTNFLITTHSNALLDFTRNANIHHIMHNGIESKIDKIFSTRDLVNLFEDLGYKSSDLLHSNCVIWVEGPTDRTILKRWLELTDNSLKEGLHFSIMIYGGRLLSHLSYQDKNKIREQEEMELINLFPINHNCAILLDSDRSNGTSKLRGTAERIRKELKDNGYCWITIGREIENYIPNAIWERYLCDKYDKQINIKFNKYVKINNVIENACKKNKINEKEIIRYDKNKMKHIKELIKYIDQNSMHHTDLQKKLNGLIAFIKKCNN